MLAISWLLLACVSTDTSSLPIENAEKYFAVFSKRQNIEKLLVFYHPNAQLQDIVYGDHIIGRDAIKGFYRWDDPAVKLLENQSLVVLQQVSQDQHVVTRGYFTPFLYHGEPLGPWRFVIWQEFDANGLIIKQYDWINYTPKETFLGGDNLNPLINQQ